MYVEKDLLGALLAVLGLSVAAFSVLILAFYILLVIASWKIFKKAGIASWKSIIPVVNVYYLFKLSWNGKMGWVYILLALVAGITASYIDSSIAMAVIACIATLVGIVIHIMFCARLSQAFGHRTGWTLGLLFLESIFTLMLGFGKSEYKGPVA